MKNIISKLGLAILAGVMMMANCVLAAPKLKTDNLPGLPGQSDEYWAEVRKEQEARLAQQPVANGEENVINFYTGKPYDAELGAYVFKFRNYNPETQRWTVMDPSGFPDGANNYCYVVGNPIALLDALGTIALEATSATITVDTAQFLSSIADQYNVWFASSFFHTLSFEINLNATGLGSETHSPGITGEQDKLTGFYSYSFSEPLFGTNIYYSAVVVRTLINSVEETNDYLHSLTNTYSFRIYLDYGLGQFGSSYGGSIDINRYAQISMTDYGE